MRFRALCFVLAVLATLEPGYSQGTAKTPVIRWGPNTVEWGFGRLREAHSYHQIW